MEKRTSKPPAPNRSIKIVAAVVMIAVLVYFAVGTIAVFLR